MQIIMKNDVYKYYNKRSKENYRSVYINVHRNARPLIILSSVVKGLNLLQTPNLIDFHFHNKNRFPYKWQH